MSDNPQGGRPRRTLWWKNQNNKKDIDTWDQTTSKYVEFENWTGLNYNRNSKMIRYYCEGKCKLDPEYDKRKLIAYAYDLGLKKCSLCECYFKTIKIRCPCCNKQLRNSRRQKNKT